MVMCAPGIHSDQGKCINIMVLTLWDLKKKKSSSVGMHLGSIICLLYEIITGKYIIKIT